MAKKTTTKTTKTRASITDPKIIAQRTKAKERAKELRAQRKAIKTQRDAITEAITIEAMNDTISQDTINNLKAELSVLASREAALVNKKSVWEEMEDGRLIRHIVVDEHYTIDGKIDPAANGAHQGMVALEYDGTTVLYTSGAHTSVGVLQQRFNKVIAAYRAIVSMEIVPGA